MNLTTMGETMTMPQTCVKCLRKLTAVAANCPWCQEPISDDQRMKLAAARNIKQFGIIGAGAIALLFVVIKVSPAAPEAPAPAPRGIISASPEELRAAYDANEAAAQLRYGNAVLIVEGKVASIQLDVMNEPVIKLETSRAYDEVSVNLTETEQSSAANLVKGQTVKVQCDEVSEVLGTPVLRECFVR